MDISNVKVSIVVPAYNAEKTISQCLDSIVSQTLPEIEVIVVDDGSTDGTEKICTSYKDDRLHYYRKENGGPSTARNFGISVATGEFIGFVDADDYIVPTMYEKLYAASTENNLDICVCDYKIIYDSGKDAYYSDLLRGGYFSQEQIQTEVLPVFLGATTANGTLRNTDWSVLRRLFRRSFLTRINLCFDETLSNSEDCLFSFLAVTKARSLAYLKNEYLYINVRNSKSLTRKYLSNYWNQRCQLMTQLEAVISQTQAAWQTPYFPIFVLLCVRPSFTNVAYGFGKVSMFRSLKEFRTIVYDPRVRKMCDSINPEGFNEEWRKLYNWCKHKRYFTLYFFYMDTMQHNKLCHFIRRVQKALERRLSKTK